MKPTETHLLVLRGRSPARTSPMDRHEWEQLLAEGHAHRTIGYLARAVEEGGLPTTPEQRAAVHDRHEALMRHALVVDDAARALVGIVPDAIVLKGVAAAHLDHEDPALRCYQDVDVLVPAGSIEAAVRDLSATGAIRELPPRSPDWDRRFAKDITFVGPTGVELDCHRTVVPGPFGFTIDLAELTEGQVTFELGGVPVRALGAARRVIASALALTVGEDEPRLAAALDLAGALGLHVADVDEVIELAERWRVGSLLAEGIGWTVSHLGDESVPEPLRRWAVTREVSSWERRWRRLHTSAGGSNTATLLGAPLGMTSWSDRRSYLRALLRPTVEYRHARDRAARPREWRTGAAELLRRGP